MFLSCLQLCTLHSEVLHCFRAVECCVRSVALVYHSSSLDVCIPKKKNKRARAFLPPPGCSMSAMGIASTTWGRRLSSLLSHTWTNWPNMATRPTRQPCTASSVPCSSPKATTMRYAAPMYRGWIIVMSDAAPDCLEPMVPTFPGVQVVHRGYEGNHPWAPRQSSGRRPPAGLQG